jgi:hypothetical protein
MEYWIVGVLIPSSIPFRGENLQNKSPFEWGLSGIFEYLTNSINPSLHYSTESSK